MDRYDVAILGSGPAGLAAACEAQAVGLSHVIIDRRGLAHSFVEYPQTLRFFSPAEEMAVGGVPFPMRGGEKPTREDALAYYRAVVHSRALNLATWEDIEALEPCAEGFHITTVRQPLSAGIVERTARAVIVATGLWAHPRRLECPGADMPHVLSRFVEPTEYFGLPVLVVGGGNSALTAALSLAEAHARVRLATRRVPEAYQSRLRPFVVRDVSIAVAEGALTLHPGVAVHAIDPDGAWLAPVEYDPARCAPCGEPFRVEARFVFALVGYEPDVGFLCRLGLRPGPDGRPLSDRATYETTVPGVYVAGSLAGEDVDVVLKGREQARRVVREIARRFAH